MKVYQAIAKAVHDLGGGPLFGLSGDGNLFINHSFVHDHSGHYVAATHEADATSMALGYAQATGKTGQASVTHGPGLTNCLTGLAEGVKLHVPMVLIAGATSSRNRNHLQKLDQRACVMSVGAGFEPVRGADTVVEDVWRAHLRAAVEQRPIILEVSVDIQWMDVDYAPLEAVNPSLRYCAGTSTDMDNAIGIIASSSLPIVLAGRGAIDTESKEALLKFAERLEVPVATTLRAKDLFRGEQFNLGFYGSLSNPVASEYISRADCVIAFGASVNRHTADFDALIEGKRIIQVDPRPQLAGQTYPVDAVIAGSAPEAVQEMIRLLDLAEIPGFRSRSETLARELSEFQWDGAFNKARVADTVDVLSSLKALDAAIPFDRFLVTDTGRFLPMVWQYIGVPEPRRFIHTTGFAAIGASLGEAIGVAFVNPEATVLCVVGDGGMILTGFSELLTAVRERLNLVIVILNDGGYGAEVDTFKTKGLTPDTVIWPHYEFAKFARPFGVQTYKVASSDDLISLGEIIENREKDKPLLVDIRLDAFAIPYYPH